MPAAIRAFLYCLCIALPLLSLNVAAQSSSRQSLTPTPTPTVFVTLTTSNITVTTSTRIGNQIIPVTTTIQSAFNATLTSTLTPSPTSTPTPTPAPIVLATKLDPAFGFLGALLILTGIPSAFWGHKNRWTSFFLIGFYTLSLVCAVLILKFGVLPSVNPPSKKLRGMFVLSSVIAGVAGGGISIFFWKGAKFFIGAWGGFALGMFIQCFRNGGLIRGNIGLMWILYIACAVVGFILCTIPKIHYQILLVSTALVGATAFMLGVDCYTTAGLKELYIWNLGFKSLFPKFSDNGIEFPVSPTMQIELGLLGAVALMGMAVQFRVLAVLQRKLREIAEEQRKRDEEAEARATERFSHVLKEREEWEKEHPILGTSGRRASGSIPQLMKEHDGSTSPTTDEHNSTFTLVNGRRSRYQSGVSEFLAAPPPEDELRRATRDNQRPGVLPVLDLGLGIQDDVPRDFIAQEDGLRGTSTALKQKEELLAEIQTIRKSIDALKSEAPSRQLSSSSGSPLVPGPSHLRPPRAADPRTRAYSMELHTLSTLPQLGESISRPSSAPLRDNDWDSYVRDRKLLQPPSGTTQPIPTTRLSIPPAVAEALTQRIRRESALEHGIDSSSDDVPVANLVKHKKNPSANIPLSVLPPSRQSPIAAPSPQRPTHSRTRTFEELTQRHREKMRDLQAPLSQAEKEQADIEAARNRWERSKAVEREVVTKRQAEKAALAKEAEKKRKSDEGQGGGRRSMTLKENVSHGRSLSADKLATLGTSSRRLSMLKVEDWQRYQQDLEMGPRNERASSADNHDSHAIAIPFPRDPRHRETNFERRKSGYSRDAPN